RGTGGSAGSSGSGAGGDGASSDGGSEGDATSVEASREAGSTDSGAIDGGASARVTMSFFVTSSGSAAMGGNLGGLAGADMKCQGLAETVMQGHKKWAAYLSVSSAQPVHARDRIGFGPW